MIRDFQNESISPNCLHVDKIIIIIIIIIIIYLLTEIGLSPGGSDYFTCIQNMKLVTSSREGYMRSM